MRYTLGQSSRTTSERDIVCGRSPAVVTATIAGLVAVCTSVARGGISHAKMLTKTPMLLCG